jgi:flagellar hook-length control protein FliK
VVSVTSEVLANVSFLGASARSGRPDSDSSNNSFAALVDSNAAPSNSDNRPQDTSRDIARDASSAPAPAPRRADDPPPADNRSRDDTTASDKSASDKAARNDSDDHDADPSARDDANADIKVDTPRRSKSKSDASKSEAAKADDTKPASKSSSDETSAATDQTGTTQDATAVVTANAVATAIPVAAAAVDASAAKPATDKAAPLAIAAAAIAASQSAANGTTPATTPASAVTDAATAATNGKTGDASTATNAATVAETVTAQVTTSSGATVTTGVALAASPTTKVASKTATGLKAPVVTKEGAAVSGEQDGTADTSDTSTVPAGTAAAVTPPQAATASKPKAESGLVDAVKPDASGNSAPTSAVANAAGNGHAATVDTSQAPVNSSNNGVQAASAIQLQQQPSANTAAAPAPQLTVTAATHAAVPLSGLAMEIAASAKSGKSRFEIRLDPADLGRIDVRIDVDRNGQVTSHLTVERPETLSMLRQDANQLQRALDNAGLSTGNGGLQFSLRDQSSQGQNNSDQSNPNAHRLIVSEEETIPAAAAGRSYGRMLGASGGVDIRI